MDRRAFVMHGMLGAAALGTLPPRSGAAQAAGTAGATGATWATGSSDLPGLGLPYWSWDAGSGPNRAYWSQKLLLPWAHAGVGDWLDAHQQPQGDWAYAEVPADVGTVQCDITALLQRWLHNGNARGIYLRSTEAWPLRVAGRTHPVLAARPVLRVQAPGRSWELPCACNANWSPSSFASPDSRAQFDLAAGSQMAALHFDLAPLAEAGPPASLRATLQLTVLARKNPARLQVLELDPPAFRIGGGAQPPAMGIAQAYPWDKGLQHHPDVLLAADFSDLSRKRWQSGSVAEGSSQVRDGRSGSTQLAGLIPAGSNHGCDLEHSLMQGTRDGIPTRVETALYARYYLRLEDDWGSEVDANKMPGWDGRFGWWNPVGYWQSTTGNGGARPSGMKRRNSSNGRWEFEGASMRGHGGPLSRDGNPYDHLFWLGNYIYHLDQVGDFGEPMPWTGMVIDKGHWHCIEQHIRMNSISGPFDALGNGQAVADGHYSAWVDGVPAFARDGLRWRRHPDMGIQGFWLNWYHGGTALAPRAMHYRMDALVIARSYIGPRNQT